jgi:hypothetical protein
MMDGCLGGNREAGREEEEEEEGEVQVQQLEEPPKNDERVGEGQKQKTA